MFVACIDSDRAGVPLHTLGGSGLRREGTPLWLQLRQPSEGNREPEPRPQLSETPYFSLSETVVVFCRETKCSLRFRKLPVGDHLLVSTRLHT